MKITLNVGIYLFELRIYSTTISASHIMFCFNWPAPVLCMFCLILFWKGNSNSDLHSRWQARWPLYYHCHSLALSVSSCFFRSNSWLVCPKFIPRRRRYCWCCCCCHATVCLAKMGPEIEKSKASPDGLTSKAASKEGPDGLTSSRAIQLIVLS